VNRFQVATDHRPHLLRVDEAVQTAQIERLRRVRAQRDNHGVERALIALQDAARGDQNLMEFILPAVEAYATMGEICNALRRVFGEYQSPTSV
jgi:methylmalonyl-CoA mutase N-terminal domain/subunit